MIAMIDLAAGNILRTLYFRQKTGQNQSLNYVFSQCKADMLVFGNSRAQHHYNSHLLSDSLKLSCYNAGQDGGHCILLSYAQIKVITERYSPKIIIVELSPDGITHYERDYERLSILLPYYKEYPEIRPLILLRSIVEKIKLISAIYPFNSDIINIIRYNTNTHAARKQDIEGFIPLEGVMSADILRSVNKIEAQPVPVVDTNMVNALKNIIRLCKAKSISLFIINSPDFHTLNEKQVPPSSAAQLTLEIIRRNNVNYIDFSFDSAFAGHREWFKDRGHLNNDGAKIFSTLLARKIKETLQNPIVN
jgi:hypothetical protein